MEPLIYPCLHMAGEKARGQSLESLESPKREQVSCTAGCEQVLITEVKGGQYEQSFLAVSKQTWFAMKKQMSVATETHHRTSEGAASRVSTVPRRRGESKER